MSLKIDKAFAFKAFYCVSSCAESMQGLALIYSIFVETKSALWVGVAGSAAYLPGVIASILFRSVADGMHAERHLSVSNSVLAVGSIALLLSETINASLSIYLIVVLLSQSILSITKAFNKAFAGRIIRLHFADAKGVDVLQKATALGVIGGLVGAGAAGLLIDLIGVAFCFVLTCALYIGSVYFANHAVSKKNTFNPPQLDDGLKEQVDHEGAGSQLKVKTSGRHLSRIMRLVLIFTVPSSALLPYINTMIPPLADFLMDGSIGFYLSLLTVSASVGGAVAGMCLSVGTVSLVSILNWSLVLSGINCLAFVFIRSPLIAPVFLFLCAFFGTLNVLAMQVLTNQAPSPQRVGSFTLVRNAFAGLAKAGSSLLAGAIISVSGLMLAWSIVACCLLFVGGCWLFVVSDDEVREVFG